MEIRLTYKRRGMVVAAALAFLLLGLGLVLATWQSLRQQRELTERHLAVMARALLRGAEGGVVRGLRAQEGPGKGMTPGAKGFLNEVFESGDVAFVGLVNDAGRPIWTASRGGRPAAASEDAGENYVEVSQPGQRPAWASELPSDFWVALRKQGENQLVLTGPAGSVLAYGVQARPALSRLCRLLGPACSGEPAPPPDSPGRPRRVEPPFPPLQLPRAEEGPPAPPLGGLPGPLGGPPPGPPDRQWPGRPPHEPGQPPKWKHGRHQPFSPGFFDDPLEPDEPRLYTLIGLRMNGHLASLEDYQRAAMYQGGFVLFAGALVLGLAAAYLRRRDQGERLTRLEVFRETLLDNLPDGLLTVASDGRVASANPAAHAILGRPSGGLVGAFLKDLALVPDSQPAGEGEPAGWSRLALGGLKLETLAAPLGGGDGQPGERLVIIRDRTRQRALEEDLEEARRLAAIGGLAAGLAHEIRNPLSAIRGFAQYFLGKLKGRQPEEIYAQTMVREADRLNKVVTDLLFLARPRTVDTTPVELARFLADLRTLLGFDLDHAGARLDGSFERPLLWADPDGLKQIALNLVLNSLAAGARRIVLTSRPGEGGTWLGVRDDGRGMTAEERERALDPFYTTRQDGAGLGLPIVGKIVRDHKGRLQLASEPGRGAEVLLFFPDGGGGPEAHPEPGPAAAEDAGPAGPQPPPSPPPRRFSREDEPCLRMMTCRACWWSTTSPAIA